LTHEQPREKIHPGIVVRPIALIAAIAVALLAISGASGASAQTPKRGGTVVYGGPFGEPACFTPWQATCGAGG
jgi:hypothetical protein